jgi:signal transduction histidine kinase
MRNSPFSERLYPAFGLGLILLTALASMAILWEVPPAWHLPWTGLSLGGANTIAFGFLLARARRRPEERQAFRLLAASMVPAVGSNLFLAQFDTATWMTFAGPMGWYLGLQGVAILLQVIAVMKLPWRPAPTKPAASAKLLTILSSLIFPLSLLMVLDVLGHWRAGSQGGPGILAILATASLRSSAVGGILAYRLVQRPARAQGAAFWLLSFTALNAFLTSFIYNTSNLIAHRIVSPVAGVVVALPVALWIASMDPRPVEPEGDSTSGHLLAYTLLLVPFFGGSLLFLGLKAFNLQAIPMPVVVFLLQSVLLGFLLALALSEVHRANTRLEAKVLERTRALEAVQALALRTERLNAVAVLGSGAVHNLNNLHLAFRAGVDTLEALASRGASPDPQVLARLRSASDQANHLTQSLLAYSHPQAAATPITDLAPVVRTMGSFLTELLPASVQLEVDAGDRPVPVRLPREHAEQILVNLVLNARDALDHAGRIRVGLEFREDSVVLSVSDSGCGIPPGIQDRIFEPLFSTKADGTGLGLPSVKGYVENAGGTVTLESAPGLGSCFRIALPLAGEAG